MVDAGHNDKFLFVFPGPKGEEGIFMGGSTPGPKAGVGVLGFVGCPFGYKVVLLQYLQSVSYVHVFFSLFIFNE